MDPGLEAVDHTHVFLGAEHERNERRTWAVVGLCTLMMIAEIIGGALFGSIALVADGLHMSTHAGALLLAALAYRCARRYQTDRRFSFGTGKFGDLAGFTSAIVLAMIALFVAYELLARFLHPVGINFTEAIPIAALGLLVNIASIWLLQGGHSHDHAHAHPHSHDHGHAHDHHDGERAAHDHVEKAANRDNNMRAAAVHIMADAAVSILVIAGLLLGLLFRWNWLDPVVGLVGAVVILSWAYGLLRDTGGILLDMVPDSQLAERIRARIESGGDRLSDLHVWRLGPGHLAAILCVTTAKRRGPPYYRAMLREFPSLSHVTVEVCSPEDLDFAG